MEIVIKGKTYTQEQCDEWVCGKVKNAFGLDETIILERLYWMFMDWLADNEIDIPKFIVDCDLAKGPHPLQTVVRENLYYELIRREDDRDDFPSWAVPIFEDPYEDDTPATAIGHA